MNRREFCQTAGLLLAGTVCGGAVAPRCVERSQGFRAQKLFLESCYGNTSFVRKRLEAVYRTGCGGVLLIPGRCSVSWWSERIKAEADRWGLTVFVPVRLPSGLFRRVQRVQRLDDDGLVLLDGSVLALILYDKSRCRWTGFVPLDASTDAGSADDLVIARWLDQQMTNGARRVSEERTEPEA